MDSPGHSDEPGKPTLAIRTRSLPLAKRALYQVELRAQKMGKEDEAKRERDALVHTQRFPDPIFPHLKGKRKKGKEVIQPQVPLRLPCDDLTHLTESRFNVFKKTRFT